MAKPLTCTGCNGELEPGTRFCSHCGAGVLSCPVCEERLLESDGFCPGCGALAHSPIDLDTHPQHTDRASGWGEVVQRLRRATLGEFEIGAELGRGAMAAVFLAHEISLDRKVAIKVMSPGLLMDEGSADRFRREAITIAHLNHPNIVSVHSVRQAEGLHFFVMRYIRGRSLEQVIQQAGKLPIPTVRSILYQVGSALTYAHRSGVVHRDIKPANILIDEDGNAFLTDFGIAKVADQPGETHPGALVGTPAYMSPEQCSGGEVSGNSDQYSLGAVAYEMITGASPFSGSTFTVMQGHLEHPPQAIQDRAAECPLELESAVLRMLEKDPMARWPSIAQAKAALGAIPLDEEDPLLAQLCRLASPDSATSLHGKFMPASPRSGLSPRSSTVAGVVRTISILPPPAALETGDSFSLVALVKGEHGIPLPGKAVQWTTDTPETLRVDGTRGLATAVAPGTARLTATCEGIRARLHVQIAPPMGDEYDVQRDERVAAIQISAPPKSVKAGDSFVLTATPLDYRGGLLLGHTVQWSTSDVGVAVVTAGGWVATLGRGPVVLEATCEGASASVEVRVEAGAPAPKPDGAPKREGSPKPERPPLPNAPSSSVVEEPPLVRRRRVPRSRRRFLAVSVSVLLLTSVLWLSGALRKVPDPFHLTGMVPRVYGEASRVTPSEPLAPILRGAPASVTIIHRPRRSLLLGASTRLLAEVRDVAGRAVPGSSANWSSTDSRVARVDSASGWVQAVRPGRVWVVAASGEWRDSTRIVVRRPPAEEQAAASVSIAPHGTLRVGDTITLAAAVLDVNGATLPAAQVAWTSSQPEVLAVDSLTGRAQAHAPGTALIVANSGSSTARSQLTVLPVGIGVDTVTSQAYDPEPEPDLRSPESLQESAGESAVTFPGTDSKERTRRDVTIRLGVLQCYDALRSKDIARVGQLYRPMNKSDEDKLNRLARILQTREWSAVVGERVDGAGQVGDSDAAVEFSFELVWKDAFGGRVTSRPVFRAEFAKNDNEWGISSCRLVGSPKL